jgi:hypothetical protein
MMRHFVGLIGTASLLFAGTLSPIFAEGVRIGHLETNDDTGINWLYFRCDKTTIGQMRCDIFQTLIMKSKSQADVDAELKRQAAMDPLAEFNKGFGEACKSLVENEAEMQQVLKSGIGVDGKPINSRIMGAAWPVMIAVLDVCKKPTPENAARFFKSMLEQDQRTCKVHNDYSQSEYTWNPQTNSWTTQEGPTGPCGTVTVGTLTQDPKTRFWSYVEKKLHTSPKGALANGLSCEKFPDQTMNYKWQTTSTLEGCEYIESFPD